MHSEPPRAGKAGVFTQPVGVLPGVGRAMADKLARIGVERVGDLLFLVPQRFEDRTKLSALGSLRPGVKALVTGRVEVAEVVRARRRSLLCRLSDGTGNLMLRFFHFSDSQRRRLERGTELVCYGEVRAGRTGLEMVHPELRFVADGQTAVDDALTPVYPGTEGLHQQRIRRFVDEALNVLEREPLEDYLAAELGPGWPGLAEAIRELHRPAPDGTSPGSHEHAGDEGPRNDDDGGRRGLRRLALEELVAQRLSLMLSGAADRAGQSPALVLPAALFARFEESLPFELTGAQRRVVGEIAADLGRERPMRRLLQGDVGCGKTVVAAAVALGVAAGGRQVALMAPTELLAEQHFASFDHWLAPAGVGVEFLSGSTTGRAREAALARIRSGEAGVVVGTHALFQEGVRFDALSLVIVDEQHRFGVEQRLDLVRKGETDGRVPHQLVMTATPIPRTLAMTIYADLDYSVIDELPAGRQPVRTVAMAERRRAELVRRIETHCAGGRQAYWICPLIELSEAIDSSAAAELEKALSDALPAVAVGLVHGRMRAREKERVMREFKEARIGLLVATTVIEVGVDVPNATLMIIENAERMGLAQLHQLRGRVGRGTEASSCVLLYKPPLGHIAKRRLEVMRETNDGFEIAQLDLQLRGSGEVLGTRQTGAVPLRVADLFRDADLLPLVVELSDRLYSERPTAAEALVRRWVRGQSAYARV